MTKSFADELEQMINSQGETPRAAPMPTTVAIAERAERKIIENCPKCRGTGRFVSYSGRTLGECFTCKGAGKKAYANAAPVRAANREKAAERREALKADYVAGYAAQHPAVHAWIVAKAPTFAFAASMLEGLQRYGSLTEKQQAACERLMQQDAERDAQRAAQRASAPVAKTYPALTAIVTAFAHVTIGEIGFSKKNGEPLWWVKSGEALVGKLDADGLQLWNGKIAKAGQDRAAIEAALDEIERDPKLALAAHGHATGSCGCCGRELTDPASIERGIGPICADKIGF